jgi:type II secretory pathway predicted ATPase ExeA
MTQLTTPAERRPFLSAPSPKRYFAAAPIEEARLRIVRAIARNEGPAILIGGAGTGKSLLLAVLAEQFAPRVAVVTLAGAQLCTRRALLQMILCELGLPYRGMDEGELRLSIQQHLRGKEGPRRLVLLVDEADSLPVRLLEELRVLTNVAAEGLPLVSLVLAGGPSLEERFAEPGLEKFSQRIAARCYLAPMGREETLQYVRSQIAAVGIKPEKLFAPDALEAIYAATGGVPRVINQLGDQLVWMAEETGCTPLDATLVQQAWSDLQQLPAPWNHDGAAAKSNAGSSVIEFGELDGASFGYDSADEEDEYEADDEMPASIPIAAARPGRHILEVDPLDVTLDTAEYLLDSFDHFQEFGALELRAADPPEPPPAEEPEQPAAANPFAEPFDEEEIVLDPYAVFESELLRSAPQVINRLDRAFASELHRCVQMATSKPAAPARSGGVAKSTAVVAPAEKAATALLEPPIRLHETRLSEAAAPAPKSAASDLLIIEDDDATTAAVVQGRQFRRLFSNLESASKSHLA